MSRRCKVCAQRRMQRARTPHAVVRIQERCIQRQARQQLLQLLAAGPQMPILPIDAQRLGWQVPVIEIDIDAVHRRRASTPLPTTTTTQE